MQNSQCHSLHPEKIFQPTKSNAYIFRGSEAVFFLPTPSQRYIGLSNQIELFIEIVEMPKPHHPFQRRRDKKAFPFFLPYACGRMSTKERHCVQLPLVATSLSTAQQRYFVPHTLAFFPPLRKSNPFLPLRSIYPRASSQKNFFVFN